MNNIIFLKITNAQEKLTILTNTVQKHFNFKDKVLIFCPNEQVATYIDELLWRFPILSFLPHQKTDQSSLEHILVTTSSQNLNNASVLINLSQTPHVLFDKFKTVYELYDETHPVKEEASKAKNTHYQALGFKTIII